MTRSRPAWWGLGLLALLGSLVPAPPAAGELAAVAGEAPPAASRPPSTAAGAPRRTLFVVVDAVPFWVLDELTGEGAGAEALFRGFKGPVPLISSFPSTTSVALGGILSPFGLETSPGYEARFFDWGEARVRGGGLVSYHRIPFAWRDFFHWNRKSILRRMFGSVLPVRASIAWLQDALAAFEDSEEAVFFLYVGATDSAAHLQGPAELAAVFASLDRELVEIRRRNPDRPFETVILSDHGISGGAPLENVWGAVKRALAAAGYTQRQALKDPADVVLTPFGLVSSFEVYVLVGEAPRVAGLLTRVPGIDLCVFPAAGGWAVESAGGRATFWRRLGATGPEYRYRPETGDPLRYGELLNERPAEGPLPEGPLPEGPVRPVPPASPHGPAAWRSDRWWLEATSGLEYPDALHRLVRSFDLVENPASVLCSLAEGYMFGARKTEYGARLTGGGLRWTHGALSREATLGFLMSDAADWHPPAAARFDRALAPFAGLVPGRTGIAERGAAAGTGER